MTCMYSIFFESHHYQKQKSYFVDVYIIEHHIIDQSNILDPSQQMSTDFNGVKCLDQ